MCVARTMVRGERTGPKMDEAREASLLQSVRRFDRLRFWRAACMKMLMLQRTPYATTRRRLSLLSRLPYWPPTAPSLPRPNSRSVSPGCETARVAEFGSRGRGGGENAPLALHRVGARILDRRACRVQPVDRSSARSSQRGMQLERRSSAGDLWSLRLSTARSPSQECEKYSRARE